MGGGYKRGIKSIRLCVGAVVFFRVIPFPLSLPHWHESPPLPSIHHNAVPSHHSVIQRSPMEVPYSLITE